MFWEGIVAICAVLALVVSIGALVVALKIAREDARERRDQFQFSWTPLVAVEGGTLEGYGATRKLHCTVHLEGRGFAHNLILNLFLDNETAERAKIRVWYFKRAPATEEVVLEYQVQQPGQGDQPARIDGTFANVFKQQVTFTQGGFLRTRTMTLELTSGAPDYSWPWTTLRPA